MTFNVHHLTIEISEIICDLYSTFVCFPLDDENAKRLLNVYAESEGIAIDQMNEKEAEAALTEMMSDEITANTGTSIEEAKAFLEQKGLI